MKKSYTRAFTHEELVQLAHDYVKAGGRDATASTAEQLLDAAVDSMSGRVEAEWTDAASVDVPNERTREDGDVEIIQHTIVEALKWFLT